MTALNRSIILDTKGRGGSRHAGEDEKRLVSATRHGVIAFGDDEVPESGHVDNILSYTPGTRLRCIEQFDLLPAASVAAGTAALVTLAGTGTEIVARDTVPGIKLTTQASTPADGDNCYVAAVANTGFQRDINATQKPWFAARIMLPAITGMFASVGLNENVTDVDPSGTAGDGAMFVADPTDDISSGATAANWILHQKVDGTDTWTSTDIPLAANTWYLLEIRIDANLKPNYYINGRLVHTGVALTSGDDVKVFAGVEATGAAQASLNIQALMTSAVAA